MCYEWTFSTANIEEIFVERPKVTTKSKPSRPVLTYGQRLEVRPMYGCILHCSAAWIFGCKTREAQIMIP